MRIDDANFKRGLKMVESHKSLRNPITEGDPTSVISPKTREPPKISMMYQEMSRSNWQFNHIESPRKMASELNNYFKTNEGRN